MVLGFQTHRYLRSSTYPDESAQQLPTVSAQHDKIGACEGEVRMDYVQVLVHLNFRGRILSLFADLPLRDLCGKQLRELNLSGMRYYLSSHVSLLYTVDLVRGVSVRAHRRVPLLWLLIFPSRSNTREDVAG